MKYVIRPLILLLLTLFCGNAFAETEQGRDDMRGSYRPEERSGSKTAGEQSLSEHNKLLADIRSEVTGDESLSWRAHNVKITTEDGETVHLKGSVESEQEKSRLEQIARSHAKNVVSELEVKPVK